MWKNGEFEAGSIRLQDLADALALGAEIVAEDGDWATAAQLRSRAALYHEFVRMTQSPADRDLSI